MPADYKTNLNDLVKAASCYETCWMAEEMAAVELYVRAMELAGNAGQPDYTGKAGLALLVQDAKAWSNQVLDGAKRDAIGLYLDLQNAIYVNAALTSTDINSLSKAATCYACLSWERKKNYLAYLKWRLNSLHEPE